MQTLLAGSGGLAVAVHDDDDDDDTAAAASGRHDLLVSEHDLRVGGRMRARRAGKSACGCERWRAKVRVLAWAILAFVRGQ